MRKYIEITVESYIAEKTSGKHGKVHVRPVTGQLYPPTMDVECSRSMKNDYPVGTKFRIPVITKQKEQGEVFLYISYHWKFQVVK
ncbi:MAG: hypothetical protein MI976_02315 [Pseudomonadales bacterium]|nr:hypothetical protein [Pseudomonadales bacterium]